MPELIAHRGTPRRHRENTLPGFLAAMAAGATGWELDVHCSRDGVVVVHHDPILPSSAGALAGAAIAALDWSALVSVTVGPAGETMPTLDAVLEAAGRDVAVYVEVKARGIEAGVAACISKHSLATVAVHSFDHRIAKTMHRLSGVPTGILTDSYVMDAPHALRAADARDYWPHRDMVDQVLVDSVHAAGGRVIVWTVNEAADARRLRDMGVDGLCSDVVDDVRAALME
jgi:glycerophosphoryl diester phosphodiesterase